MFEQSIARPDKLREAEWAEFVADCGKHERELADEVAKCELTVAELDDEEQSLDGYAAGAGRSEHATAMAALSAATADQRLKDCAEALEDFAVQFYRARGRSQGLRQEANGTSRASEGRVPSR